MSYRRRLIAALSQNRQFIEGYCQPGTQTYYLHIRQYTDEGAGDMTRFYSITPDANGYWRWYVPQGKTVASLTSAFSMYSQANSEALVTVNLSHINPVISFYASFGTFNDPQCWPCTNLKSVKGMRVANDNSIISSCFVNTFYGCTSLEYVDVRGWKNASTRAVAMNYVFRECNSLTTIDGQDEWGFRVGNAYAMFRGCQNIEELDFSNFRGGGTVNDYWFYDCQKLKKIKSWGSLHFNCTNFRYHYANCYALEEIDLSVLSGDTPTNFSNAFNGCQKLEEIDLTPFGTCAVTSVSATFANCTNLKKVIGLNKIDVTNCGSFVSMCAYSRNLEDFDIHTWKPTTSTNFQSCFRECYALKINASTVWDVSGATATRVDYMYGSGSLANQNAWATATGRTPWEDFTHLSVPIVPNGITSNNYTTYHYGNDVVSTCGNISASLNFNYGTLDLASAILVLQRLQDVTGYGGATLTLSASTRAIVAADATAMALRNNAVDNLGWTITI